MSKRFRSTLAAVSNFVCCHTGTVAVVAGAGRFSLIVECYAGDSTAGPPPSTDVVASRRGSAVAHRAHSLRDKGQRVVELSGAEVRDVHLDVGFE